jgi:hypothetical protein
MLYSEVWRKRRVKGKVGRGGEENDYPFHYVWMF